MKKTISLLFLLTSLIAGCTPTNNNSTSTSDITADNTTDTTVTTDITTPDTSTGGDTTTPIGELITMPEAIAKGAQIAVDKDGNGTSSEVISLLGAVIGSYVDGTKTDRLILTTDGEEILYVRATYQTSDDYMAKIYKVGETYVITGTLRKNHHHLEMAISTKWAVSSAKISFDIKAMAKEYTLGQLNNIANTLKPYDKGAIFTEIVKFTARYIARTDNTKMLMYDGHHVISVHGDSKINNGRTIGNFYTVYGMVGKYTGMPSIEYLVIDFSSSGTMADVDYDAGDVTNVDLSTIYKNRPDSWENQYFPYILKATVYVDVDKRASSKVDKNEDYAIAENYLLKTSPTGRYKWQSESLYAEAVTIRNSDDLFGLDMSSSKGPSILLDPYLNNTTVEVTFIIYTYLSGSHMWAVHLLGDLDASI